MTIYYPTTASYTWAGYAATGANGSVTEALGSWIQPAVSCNVLSTDQAATWVGIDGANYHVIPVQVGTAAQCQGTVASYFAWYEFNTRNSTTISGFTVSPGDKLQATVSYNSSAGDFSVVLVDGSERFERPTPHTNATRESAECIVEANTTTYELADFGVADFGSAYTGSIDCSAVISGTAGTLGSFSTVEAFNTYGYYTGKETAAVSALSLNGGSFTVTWLGED